MQKVISIMKRADGISKADFVKWATSEHPALARDIPGLRRYVVNVTAADDDETPYDCVNELVFDDDAARVAAFESKAGQAAGADAAAHSSERVLLLTTEHPQI